MSKFITMDEINEWCKCKNDRIDKITLTGRVLPYCNRYEMFCYQCITICKQSSYDSEQNYLDSMDRKHQRWLSSLED